MQVAFDKLSDVLHCCPHFDRLLTLCATKDAYLVGGAIRDGLIGRPVADLDMVSASDPTPIAKLFARQIGGHWFWLDKERLQSRVVVHQGGDGLHYDFALFRAPDLESDLLDRDFTINALALPLSGDQSGATLVDPCCGLKDLQQGSLRMVGKNSFADDPLRIIKGVRHATSLGLKIEAATQRTMQTEVEGLDSVAPERIRLEIWKTLASEYVERGLQLLREVGAGEKLFGSSFVSLIEKLKVQPASHRDVWHQLGQGYSIFNDCLAQEVEQGLSNETLLIWTLLLASIDRDLPIHLAEKWRLSRKARANIVAITGLDQNALNEFATIARNERAFSWWADSYRIDPKLLLLAIAVACSPDITFTLEDIQTWVPLVARLNDQRLNDLVDGHWLRKELLLKDGPEMTKALQRLRNAEIIGQVSSQKEARMFLRQYYQNRD